MLLLCFIDIDVAEFINMKIQRAETKTKASLSTFKIALSLQMQTLLSLSAQISDRSIFPLIALQQTLNDIVNFR